MSPRKRPSDSVQVATENVQLIHAFQNSDINLKLIHNTNKIS